MIISIIVAKAKNNAIGKDNQLLWHISEDLKHFKEITSGHSIIMGRKTYESIGRPLPNRRNIIISRKITDAPTGTEIAKSLEHAIMMCEGEEEIFITGGGQIYKEAIDIADRLYITEVDGEPEADTFFPSIENDDSWKECFREKHEGFCFINYER